MLDAFSKTSVHLLHLDLDVLLAWQSEENFILKCHFSLQTDLYCCGAKKSDLIRENYTAFI